MSRMLTSWQAAAQKSGDPYLRRIKMTVRTMGEMRPHVATMQGRRRSTNVQTFLLRFFGDSSGATAIEYALVACGIGMAIVSVIGQLGATVAAKFELANTGLK
jgi:pilus assembly protein Flp/PilA